MSSPKSSRDRQPKRRHKSFATIDSSESEPLTFDITTKDGVEEFACYPEIPGKLLLDIMRPAAEADEDRAGVIMAVSVLEFFPKVMEPSEWERLSKTLDDPKNVVRMEQLSEIMSWLIEEYSERPTEQP